MNYEINKVLQEIEEFSQRLLPDLARRDPLCFGDYLHGDFEDWRRKLRTLEDWQNAAGRLIEWFKENVAGKSRPLDLHDFKRFIAGGEADRHYEMRDGKIYWRLSVYKSVRWEDQELRYIPDDCRPDRVGGLAPSMEATKQWFRRASVEDAQLWNALCTDLPALADQDPKFAMSMLQPAAYRDRIRSNDELTPSQQQAELENVDALFFKHVLNNALLHVVAALANNHFMQIQRFLQVPNRSGRYTDLIPHYLFAVLLAKVDVLPQLCVA